MHEHDSASRPAVPEDLPFLRRCFLGAMRDSIAAAGLEEPVCSVPTRTTAIATFVTFAPCFAPGQAADLL